MRIEHTQHSEIVDSESLAEALIGALPQIQEQMLSLLGRRPQRITQRDRTALKKKIRKLVESLCAQVRKFGSARLEAEPERLAALLQGVLAAVIQAGGIRRKRGEDTLDLLMRFAFKQTVPPKHPWVKRLEYEDTRRTLWAFVMTLYRLGASEIHDVVERWAEEEGEDHISFLRQLETAARRFRVRPPARLTDRLIVDLQTEYRFASAFFEKRLRLLVYLAREGSPKSKPWSEWKIERLNNLLEIARTNSSLAPLVGGIDRQVRNALAHGAPLIDMRTGSCTFDDSGRKIQWTFQEFFEKTRSLTVTAVALTSLEPFLEYAHVYWLVCVFRCLRQTDHATIETHR